MSLKDKLQIALVTYNRKRFLDRTLKQLLAENSPIKDFDIIILDNASSDGTSELIEEYCSKFDNITHIRHNLNIGGNANICRAFETAAAQGKEYLWILCDDDMYDFSNWSEVEDLVNKKAECICLCDYVFPTEKDRKNPAWQLVQMTFVPAGIFRTDLFTDNVMQNMYNSIFTLFQQLCPVCEILNRGGKINVLSKPVVFNGIHFEDQAKDFSYTRGLKNNQKILQRSKDNSWPLGYANIITLLDDVELQGKTFEAAMRYKDICGGMKKFYRMMNELYIESGKYNYFYEIYNILTPKMKNLFINNLNDLNFFAYDLGRIKELEREIDRKLDNMTYLFKHEKVKFLQWIFSVRNTRDGRHKKWCILGIKFKFKRKVY